MAICSVLRNRFADRSGWDSMLVSSSGFPCGPVLELDVGAERGDDDGATVAVIAGIGDVLHAGRQINTAPHVNGVIGLEDVFAAVVEVAVAEEESEAAAVEVVLVILLDRIPHEAHAGATLLALPPRAARSHTFRERLIHFRIGEGFG